MARYIPQKGDSFKVYQVVRYKNGLMLGRAYGSIVNKYKRKEPLGITSGRIYKCVDSNGEHIDTDNGHCFYLVKIQCNFGLNVRFVRV